MKGKSMKIEIEIPEEFEIDFNTDKFKDFFERAKADMNCLCGNYEKETADMFIEAFNNAVQTKTKKKCKREDVGKTLEETEESSKIKAGSKRVKSKCR